MTDCGTCWLANYICRVVTGRPLTHGNGEYELVYIAELAFGHDSEVHNNVMSVCFNADTKVMSFTDILEFCKAVEELGLSYLKGQAFIYTSSGIKSIRFYDDSGGSFYVGNDNEPLNGDMFGINHGGKQDRYTSNYLLTTVTRVGNKFTITRRRHRDGYFWSKEASVSTMEIDEPASIMLMKRFKDSLKIEMTVIKEDDGFFIEV